MNLNQMIIYYIASPSHYRSISTLGINGKLFDNAIINKTDFEHRDMNNLLCDEQYSFRSGRSTAGEVNTITQRISEALDDKHIALYI